MVASLVLKTGRYKAVDHFIVGRCDDGFETTVAFVEYGGYVEREWNESDQCDEEKTVFNDEMEATEKKVVGSCAAVVGVCGGGGLCWAGLSGLLVVVECWVDLHLNVLVLFVLHWGVLVLLRHASETAGGWGWEWGRWAIYFLLLAVLALLT